MRIKQVVAGVTIAAGGLLLAGCDWDRGTAFSDQESFSQPIKEVRFTNDSGDIKITAVGDAVEVRRSGEYGNTKPGKTYRIDGDALVLEACPERDCWVGYEVTVPAGTKVNGRLDSGNVDLSGVASANVGAESGDVTIRDVAGEVNATTQSGGVDVSGIGGAVVAGAESGDITVGLDVAANVSVTTQSGNIDVTVPKASYQVDATTESGAVTNEVGQSTSGPAIKLRAESGDVTIRSA